jgi:hypothetical protein
VVNIKTTECRVLVEVEKQCDVEISNRFAALGNFMY